ncbi:MAG: ribonucleotide-diphosphate reductase subunit beta [Actinomycetota bacterium]|nr:ribonucleotide-diphosphate reductase subunit beta [Actinomycetota bacterium]
MNIDDKVRRVEETPVSQLADVDIDDVYEHMDHLLRERPSPLALYDRWEAQNWRVSDLDFTEDTQHWGFLMPELQDYLLTIFTEFFLGEQAVTDTLAPLIIGAPDADSRVFLSTQIVDEARHTVFFKRFFAEVLNVSGGLNAALAAVRPGAVEGWKKIFDVDLVEATDRVRLHPEDREAWVRGITVYHFVVEGMLALTGQKYLVRVFRNLGMLPGFRAGFTAVARDESRHVNYGVGAIREQILQNPKMADVVGDCVLGLLPSACKTIEPADRNYENIQHPNDFPPPARIDPREIHRFSLTSLTKRLRVAGLSEEVCATIEARGLTYYDDQIAEFETRFDREHPARAFDRGEVELSFRRFEAHGVDDLGLP